MAGSLRAIGIDDGFFPLHYKEDRGRTVLVGVLCSGLTPIDIAVEGVTVDGLDGTDAAINVLKRLTRQLREGGEDAVIFIDGVTAAGFNVIDPLKIHEHFHIPVVTVFKHPLNLERIEDALRKHFPDWSVRLNIIRSVYGSSRKVNTMWRELRLSCFGIDCFKAASLISRLQSMSPLPEPLRLADIIASGLTRDGALLEKLNKLR